MASISTSSMLLSILNRGIDLVAKTLHSEVGPVSLDVTQQIFTACDLSFEIRTIEITVPEENFTTAYVLQVTRSKVPNPGFRDNDQIESHFP